MIPPRPHAPERHDIPPTLSSLFLISILQQPLFPCFSNSAPLLSQTPPPYVPIESGSSSSETAAPSSPTMPSQPAIHSALSIVSTSSPQPSSFSTAAKTTGTLSTLAISEYMAQDTLSSSFCPINTASQSLPHISTCSCLSPAPPSSSGKRNVYRLEVCPPFPLPEPAFPTDIAGRNQFLHGALYRGYADMQLPPYGGDCGNTGLRFVCPVYLVTLNLDKRRTVTYLLFPVLQLNQPLPCKYPFLPFPGEKSGTKGACKKES